MRKPETGGVLLGVVAILALATFAYIGYMFSRDPQKAEIVADGVQEATEGNDVPTVEVTTVATFESQSIYDQYVALGYPDDDDLPAALTDAIASAYLAGRLPIVDQLLVSPEATGHAAIVSAAKYDEVNPNVCGLYGQELCFIVFTSRDETKVIAVFDSIPGSPREHAGMPILDQFVDDTHLIVVDANGDSQEYIEEGYVVDVTKPGSLEEIARINSVMASPLVTEISSRKGVLTFAIEELGRKVAGEITITELRVAVSNETSDLGIIEGAYNEDSEYAISVDYVRSYNPSIFTGGNGDLYVWVLGNLYRYNGATFTEVIE